jgi:hypothetical protein
VNALTHIGAGFAVAVVKMGDGALERGLAGEA